MNLTEIKPETFAHNLAVVAREHFSTQNGDIAFIIERLEKSPDYQHMRAATVSASQDGIAPEAITFLCARIWRAAYFSAIFQNLIKDADCARDEIELRGSCLSPSNIDTCLVGPSEGWTEFREVNELVNALKETRYFSSQIDSNRDSLVDAGWTRPQPYTEEQRDEFEDGERAFAAAMIRVGYLAAINQLSLVCPAPGLAETGTTEELVDLLRRKIHLGGVDDEALTSGGSRGGRPEPYWTQEQVDEARRIVRMEIAPEDYGPDYAEMDAEQGGAQ